MSRTGALPPEHPVRTFEDLCLFLGGDVTSYTGLLLTLIGKADQGNLARLRAAYPRHVLARSVWMNTDSALPASELAMRIEQVMERSAALMDALLEDFDYRAPAVHLGGEPSALATVLHRDIMRHLDELAGEAQATTGSAWRQWGMSLHASPDGRPDDADLDHSTPVAHFVTVRDGRPRTHDMVHVQRWQPKVALSVVRYWRAQANGWLAESGLAPGGELAMRRLAGLQVLLTVDLGCGR